MVFVVLAASSGCGPRVSSDTDGNEARTGVSSGGQDTTSAEAPTQDEWSAHCRSIQTEDACEAQQMTLAAGYGSCSWVRWHEVLDEDACEFGDVVAGDCSANIFGGDSSPSPTCNTSSGLFICRRDDLPFPVIGVSESPCGDYDWCSIDDPVCECACELAGG